MRERDDRRNSGVAQSAPKSPRPSGRFVFKGSLHRVRTGRGVTLTQRPPREPIRHPARIAIQLALALKLQQMIDAGEIRDRAEIARRLGVTRASVSKMMRLTLLPVAEQERVLFLEAVDGREPQVVSAARGRGRPTEGPPEPASPAPGQRSVLEHVRPVHGTLQPSSLTLPRTPATMNLSGTRPGAAAPDHEDPGLAGERGANDSEVTVGHLEGGAPEMLVGKQRSCRRSGVTRRSDV